MEKDKRLGEFEKMLKKTKLTEVELKEFIEKTKNNNDPKTEHRLAFRTLTNPIRRNILEYINNQIRTSEDIKSKFNLDESQFNLHLNMLKQTSYIIDSVEGWKATPKGIGFLENAQLGV